jgi:hypothetical protein
LKIREVEVTSSDTGDAPKSPALPSQIPPDQQIASVASDGACDRRKCRNGIAERGGHAAIPAR